MDINQFNEQYNNENNSYQQPINYTKPKKKHKGIGCLCVLLVFVLLIVSIPVGINLKNKSIEKSQWKFDNSYGDFVLSDEEKKEDWNNDGISNGEAEKLGLNLFETDTDGDGLSDADEINTYHSNPTKYSTSNDGYSDGYKVKNNIKIDEKLSMKNDNIEIENTGIVLHPKKEGDAERWVYKKSNVSFTTEYSDCFTLYSYKGDVFYPTDDNKTIKTYYVEPFTGELKSLKHKKVDGGIEFTNIENAKLLFSMKDVSVDFEQQETEYYIAFSPILSVFGSPIYMFYNNENGSLDDERVSKDLSDWISSEAELDSANNEIGSNLFKVDVRVEGKSGLALKIIKKFCQNVDDEISTAMQEGGGSEAKQYKYLFYVAGTVRGKYSDLKNLISGNTDESEENQEEEPTENQNEFQMAKTSGEWYVHTGFRQDVNAFRFCNFISGYSNGVCAGFTAETMQIYNGGFPLNKSKKNDTSVDNLSYDLSDDATYKYTKDKNLYEYTPTDAEVATLCDNDPDESYIVSKYVTEPDQEVIKSLEYWWDESNDKRSKYGFQNYTLIVNNHIVPKNNFSEIESIRDEFKSGRVVGVSLFQENLGGHSILAYAMSQSSFDDDLFYVKAYDNNYPCDTVLTKSGSKKLDTIIYIQRYYEKDAFGVEHERYHFSYGPSYIISDIDSYGAIYFYDKNNKKIN